jgi:hypothetical protein
LRIQVWVCSNKAKDAADERVVEVYLYLRRYVVAAKSAKTLAKDVDHIVPNLSVQRLDDGKKLRLWSCLHYEQKEPSDLL